MYICIFILRYYNFKARTYVSIVWLPSQGSRIQFRGLKRTACNLKKSACAQLTPIKFTHPIFQRAFLYLPNYTINHLLYNPHTYTYIHTYTHIHKWLRFKRNKKSARSLYMMCLCCQLHWNIINSTKQCITVSLAASNLKCKHKLCRKIQLT